MTQTTKRHIPLPVAAAIDEATRLLVDTAHPEKIVLFGSYARGDFDARSDVDFLVIVREVGDWVDETARLMLALKDVPMAADIILYPRAEVERRRRLRGTMLYHALREGRVLYDAA